VSPFEELHPALRYHVVNTLRWSDLRPTQLEAIRPVQAGDDVLLLAPTAGGKTEAALLPLLSRMAIGGWQGLSALYLCPLRALLNNLAPRVERYATMMGRRAALWHGDVGAAPRHRILRELPDLLLTTPESLEAVLISPRVDHHGLLSDVRTVIVDELHAFAGDDRGWHLLALLERVERLVGRRPQRIGLSATIGNADELLAWLTRGRGGHVVGPTKPPADGDVTADHVGSLQNAVTVLSRVYRGERRLVLRLEEIRERLDFVDGSSIPVVRDATGRTTVWTFAGDRANAMLAGGLRARGMSVVSANGLALVVRNADGSAVAAAIDRVDPTSALPEVPPGSRQS
jgi:ATP-dependent Lhr-like helicase